MNQNYLLKLIINNKYIRTYIFQCVKYVNNLIISYEINNKNKKYKKTFIYEKYNWYGLSTNPIQLIRYNYLDRYLFELDQLIKENHNYNHNNNISNNNVLDKNYKYKLLSYTSVLKDSFIRCRENADIESMNFLLNQYLDVHIDCYFVINQLFKSAKHGQLDVLKFFLNKYFTNTNSSNNSNSVSNSNSDKELYYENLFSIKTFKDVQNRYYFLEYYYSVSKRLMDKACSGGNISVIRYLHENRTEGCSDSALSSAIINNHIEVVKFLFEHYSKDIFNNSSSNMFDYLNLASNYGNLEMMKYLNENLPKAISITSTETMYNAAKYGFIDIVKYLHFNRTEGCTTKAMDIAARKGYFDIVKFLHYNRTEGCTRDAIDQMECYLNNNNSNSNNSNSNNSNNIFFEIVKFLIKNRTEGFSENGIKNAATKGNIEIFDFLINNDQTMMYSNMNKLLSNCMELANDMDMLTHIYDLFKKIQPAPILTKECLINAVIKGNMDMVKFIVEKTILARSINSQTTTSSMQVDLFNFENTGTVGDQDSFFLPIDLAVIYGSLEMVHYLCGILKRGGCSVRAMNFAAQNNKMDVLCYLHENRTEGCTVFAMNIASMIGNIEMVKFLHEHRTEGCTTEAMDNAASNGHLNVVKFLHYNRTEGCTKNALDKAFIHNHYQVAQFLDENRTEGCSTSSMDNAAKSCNLSLIRFLHYNRTEGNTIAAIENTKKYGCISIARFLNENRFLDSKMIDLDSDSSDEE